MQQQAFACEITCRVVCDSQIVVCHQSAAVSYEKRLGWPWIPWSTFCRFTLSSCPTSHITQRSEMQDYVFLMETLNSYSIPGSFRQQSVLTTPKLEDSYRLTCWQTDGSRRQTWWCLQLPGDGRTPEPPHPSWCPTERNRQRTHVKWTNVLSPCSCHRNVTIWPNSRLLSWLYFQSQTVLLPVPVFH